MAAKAQGPDGVVVAAVYVEYVVVAWTASYVTIKFALGRLIVGIDCSAGQDVGCETFDRHTSAVPPPFPPLLLLFFALSRSFLAPPTHWRSICLADRNPCSPSRYHSPPPPPYLAITPVKGPSKICTIFDDVFRERQRLLLLRLVHKHKLLPVLIQFTAPE